MKYQILTGYVTKRNVFVVVFINYMVNLMIPFS